MSLDVGQRRVQPGRRLVSMELGAQVVPKAFQNMADILRMEEILHQMDTIWIWFGNYMKH